MNSNFPILNHTLQQGEDFTKPSKVWNSLNLMQERRIRSINSDRLPPAFLEKSVELENRTLLSAMQKKHLNGV